MSVLAVVPAAGGVGRIPGCCKYNNREGVSERVYYDQTPPSLSAWCVPVSLQSVPEATIVCSWSLCTDLLLLPQTDCTTTDIHSPLS